MSLFSGLDRFGLPVKYAVIGFLGGLAVAIVAALMELRSLETGLYIYPGAGIFGGLIGGFMREQRGKRS